jgi:hypothetical protein
MDGLNHENKTIKKKKKKIVVGVFFVMAVRNWVILTPPLVGLGLGE